MQSYKVVSSAKDDMGNVIGVNNSVPILDIRMHGVLFPDLSMWKYAENFIADNMHSQVGSEGYQYQLMDDILNHRRNGDYIRGDDSSITSRSGRKTQHYTNKGWFLCVRWKYGSYSWVAIKDINYFLTHLKFISMQSQTSIF